MAVFFAVILTGLFVYLRFTFGNTPLQRFYTPIYNPVERCGQRLRHRKDKYRLVMMVLAESNRDWPRTPT